MHAVEASTERPEVPQAHGQPGRRVDDPLDRQCPGCEGAGRVMARAWRNWMEEYRRIEFGTVDPVARLTALIDHMRAQPSPHRAVRACPQCGGSGLLPTERGQELLDFLERHLPGVIDRYLWQTEAGARQGGGGGRSGGGRPSHLRSV